MRQRVRILAAAGAVAAAASAMAYGQAAQSPQSPQSAQPAPAPQAASAIPQGTRKNGVHWVCGWVGSDEARAMKAAAREHNLMLTFATRKGDYLSDIAVRIDDARGGALIETTCEGPIMLVDVPKGGTYRIHGALAGRRVSSEATVTPASKGKTLHLVIPEAPSQAG